MILQPWHFTGVAKKRGSDTLAKKSNNLQKRMISSACWAAAASLLLFYLGNRIFAYVDPTTLSSDYLTQILIGLDDMAVNPIAIRLTAPGLIIGALLLLIVWFAWGQHIVFMGNYRTGEESGSAKWADEKEMSAFLDSDDPSNNLLFTDKYGLAISRKKFDPEHDRNLNVCVIGGSGSGKTYRYVKPNLMQLNSNYFLTDPKGTLLDECGWLFADNGYKVMSFDMVRKDKSMHYNPLKYVRTDDEILTFVNCLILNTNGDKPNTGDAFWENSEKMLYTALIALMRDWFPENEYNLDTLLKLLSMAKASENDENYMSPLDKVFNQIETGYTEVAVADDDVAVANDMQSMFAYPTVLRYFSRFANEGRKFGMLLTGITQNATAMLDNEAARNIVTNADFLMLLKQSPLDRKEWIRLLNLSEQEEECIDESTEPGNGLLIAGAARVPIRGKFPKDNALYELFSTNPNDKKELEERIARFGA